MVVWFFSPAGLPLFSEEVGDHPPPTVRVAPRVWLDTLQPVQPVAERTFLRETLWDDERDCFAGFRYVEKNPSVWDAREAIDIALAKRRSPADR